MKCYRTSCKLDCDKYKLASCLFRITKEQKDLIAEIKKQLYCNVCGEMLVKAKYGELEINLCTKCGVRGRVA